MGKNKIGKFLAEATKDFKFTESKSCKITNHSVRKTCIKTLLDAGVPHNNVAQLSGHNSLESLGSYTVASESKKRSMSKILSGSSESCESVKPTDKKARFICSYV